MVPNGWVCPSQLSPGHWEPLWGWIPGLPLRLSPRTHDLADQLFTLPPTCSPTTGPLKAERRWRRPGSSLNSSRARPRDYLTLEHMVAWRGVFRLHRPHFPWSCLCLEEAPGIIKHGAHVDREGEGTGRSWCAALMVPRPLPLEHLQLQSSEAASCVLWSCHWGAVREASCLPALVYRLPCSTEPDTQTQIRTVSSPQPATL